MITEHLYNFGQPLFQGGPAPLSIPPQASEGVGSSSWQGFGGQQIQQVAVNNTIQVQITDSVLDSNSYYECVLLNVWSGLETGQIQIEMRVNAGTFQLTAGDLVTVQMYSITDGGNSEDNNLMLCRLVQYQQFQSNEALSILSYAAPYYSCQRIRYNPQTRIWDLVSAEIVHAWSYGLLTVPSIQQGVFFGVETIGPDSFKTYWVPYCCNNDGEKPIEAYVLCGGEAVVSTGHISGIITDCCPDGLPEEYDVYFNSACECLDGAVVTVTWNYVEPIGSWVGSTTVCTGKTLSVEIYCSGVDASGLYANLACGTGTRGGFVTSGSCDPFELTWEFDDWTTTDCCAEGFTLSTIAP